jgi:hypothetical protein
LIGILFLGFVANGRGIEVDNLPDS